MLTSGQLLVDRYRLARRIAVGGMGEVWEAADTRLDRSVAIKILKPELCGDAEFLHRFRTEARTTASLNHPGIAAVHDYGETAAVPDGPEDTAYLVMELVEGEPLAAILAREGRMGADRMLDVLGQAAAALQAAHERGLVHRDVKPGNILVTPAGKVKLTDFGIAKAADAAPVTRSGLVMGTAHYIAPEQALGGEAEPASDVYSLAVVGYECLAGHRPFLSDNAVTVAMMHIRDAPPPLPPDVPPGVRALLDATLVKDPRQRYRTGGAFAAAVAAVRAGRPLPPPSGLTSVGPPAAMAGVGMPGTGGLPHAMVPGPRMGGPGPVTVPGTMRAVPHGGMPSPPTGSFAAWPAPPRRSRAPLWVLLAVLVAALVALGVWGVRGVFSSGASTPQHPNAPRGSGGAPRGQAAASPRPDHPAALRDRAPAAAGEHATVEVEATAYLDLPAREAIARLDRVGLAPNVLPDTTGARPADLRYCTVTEVTPTGAVPIGSGVTVRCRPIEPTS
jgi:tRNA A-37 threonylcarbamoyl transferase component Bud32